MLEKLQKEYDEAMAYWKQCFSGPAAHRREAYETVKVLKIMIEVFND